jgi:hypothetical protein
MEKNIPAILILSCFIITLSLIGFYPTYLQHLPDLATFPWLIHLHFLGFIAWFILLILQPLLIMRRNVALHQKIGRISYWLVPYLAITIVLVVSQQTKRLISEDNPTAPITALIGFLDTIFFVAFYCVAIAFKKNIRIHTSCMIGASLIIFNPGLSRFVNHIQPGLGLTAALIFPFLVSSSCILYERIRFHRPILLNPYGLIFLGWSLELLLFFTVSQTALWKDWIFKFFS